MDEASFAGDQGLAAILIADDHPLFRGALAEIIGKVFPRHRIIEADTFTAAQDLLDSEDPDLVLLDLNMPGMEGFSGLILLRERAPATPIVVISAEEDPAVVRQVLTLGASGYIPKSMHKDRLMAALGLVVDGEVFVPQGLLGEPAPAVADDPAFAAGYAALTAQQRKVLELLVAGKSNKVVAHELQVTEGTVKAHVSAILRKLRVTSRTQAVLYTVKMLRGG